MKRNGGKPRRGKPRNVFDLLARIGQVGPSDVVCDRVIQSALDAGVDVDALVSRHMPGPPPRCGSREWHRGRRTILGAVVAHLADSGRLDCIAAGPQPSAGAGRSPIPGMEPAVVDAITRRADRNPGGRFRSVRRATPLEVIREWIGGIGVKVAPERLVELADRLRGLAWVDHDGHLHGQTLIDAIRAEQDAGVGDERYADAAADFDGAVDGARYAVRSAGAALGRGSNCEQGEPLIDPSHRHHTRGRASRREARDQVGTRDAEAPLSKRLSDLGWGGLDPPKVFINIVWLYLLAGFEADVPLRAIQYHGAGDGDRARAGCENAMASMLGEAERVGKLDVLRRPSVREPSEVLAMLERMAGLTSSARPDANGRAGGSC